MNIRTGLEVLLRDRPRWIRGRRVGLLSHQAAVTSDLKPTHLALREFLGANLVRLFSPQHGFYGTAQANMIPSEDTVEPLTGLPVISLYGSRLKPQPEHLAGLDLILVDLQDVGCRVYTYLWTLYLLLEAAEEAGVEVAVLDRPNPLGGLLEGPMLQPECFSFVGLSEMPLRHGLTLGEAALLFRKRLGLSLPLRVVKAEGWRRTQLFSETGLPWVPPSPNMPSFETALVYPGQVLLEGTNLSEGRGTTRPFEVFGAPWLRPERVLPALPEALPGAKLRFTVFQPTFDKWRGQVCLGFQLHVTDPWRFRPVRTSLSLLRAIARTHQEFLFRPPPYEFEEKRWPIEIIAGDPYILNLITQDMDWKDLDFYLKEGLTYYANEVASLSLYEGGFFL